MEVNSNLLKFSVYNELTKICLIAIKTYFS